MRRIGLKHYFGDVKREKRVFDINASIEVDSQFLRGENKKSKITTLSYYDTKFTNEFN